MLLLSFGCQTSKIITTKKGKEKEEKHFKIIYEKNIHAS